MCITDGKVQLRMIYSNIEATLKINNTRQEAHTHTYTLDNE